MMVYGQPRRRGSIWMGLAIAAIALVSYCSSSEFNETTGRKQYLGMTPDQEVALGLQTAPIMADQFGGLSRDGRATARVDAIGNKLVAANREAVKRWEFDFHLLADTQTINAFALPGGQVFITEALYRKLKTDDQLAGVLGHEIGHVVGRHGSAQMAKQQLTQGLTGAVAVASGDASSGQLAAVAGQLINMRYGRDDELESDLLALRFMDAAGYNPEAMIDVLNILAKSGGPNGPEFFSTHPNPGHRIERLKEALSQRTQG